MPCGTQCAPGESGDDAIRRADSLVAGLRDEIPREFGIDPLLLAVLESVVFLSGSDDTIVHPDAAESVLSRIIGTLSRLDDNRRARVLEDLATLKGHVTGPQWPEGMAEFLEQFAREISPGATE